ncbi:MAG: hypothetical protein QGG40_11980, partial [Myxococcota bacterium]|nr:hypothetical protein [Myxococcota bacterium]
GCKPGERVKTFFIGNSYSYNEDIEKRSLLIVDEAEVPSKPLGVEGTAVIQVQKVTRICVKDELESPRYTGIVAGIELTDDGKVLLSEINKEIPVEEALKGRDTWLREKLSP